MVGHVEFSSVYTHFTWNNFSTTTRDFITFPEAINRLSLLFLGVSEQIAPMQLVQFKALWQENLLLPAIHFLSRMTKAEVDLIYSEKECSSLFIMPIHLPEHCHGKHEAKDLPLQELYEGANILLLHSHSSIQLIGHMLLLLIEELRPCKQSAQEKLVWEAKRLFLMSKNLSKTLPVDILLPIYQSTDFKSFSADFKSFSADFKSFLSSSIILWPTDLKNQEHALFLNYAHQQLIDNRQTKVLISFVIEQLKTLPLEKKEALILLVAEQLRKSAYHQGLLLFFQALWEANLFELPGCGAEFQALLQAVFTTIERKDKKLELLDIFYYPRQHNILYPYSSSHYTFGINPNFCSYTRLEAIICSTIDATPSLSPAYFNVFQAVGKWLSFHQGFSKIDQSLIYEALKKKNFSAISTIGKTMEENRIYDWLSGKVFFSKNDKNVPLFFIQFFAECVQKNPHLYLLTGYTVNLIKNLLDKQKHIKECFILMLGLGVEEIERWESLFNYLNNAPPSFQETQNDINQTIIKKFNSLPPLVAALCIQRLYHQGLAVDKILALLRSDYFLCCQKLMTKDTFYKHVHTIFIECREKILASASLTHQDSLSILNNILMQIAHHPDDTNKEMLATLKNELLPTLKKARLLKKTILVSDKMPISTKKTGNNSAQIRLCQTLTNKILSKTHDISPTQFSALIKTTNTELSQNKAIDTDWIEAFIKLMQTCREKNFFAFNILEAIDLLSKFSPATSHWPKILLETCHMLLFFLQHRQYTYSKKPAISSTQTLTYASLFIKAAACETLCQLGQSVLIKCMSHCKIDKYLDAATKMSVTQSFQYAQNAVKIESLKHVSIAEADKVLDQLTELNEGQLVEIFNHLQRFHPLDLRERTHSDYMNLLAMLLYKARNGYVKLRSFTIINLLKRITLRYLHASYQHVDPIYYHRTVENVSWLIQNNLCSKKEFQMYIFLLIFIVYKKISKEQLIASIESLYSKKNIHLFEITPKSPDYLIYQLFKNKNYFFNLPLNEILTIKKLFQSFQKKLAAFEPTLFESKLTDFLQSSSPLAFYINKIEDAIETNDLINDFHSAQKDFIDRKLPLERFMAKSSTDLRRLTESFPDLYAHFGSIQNKYLLLFKPFYQDHPNETDIDIYHLYMLKKFGTFLFDIPDLPLAERKKHTIMALLKKSADLTIWWMKWANKNEHIASELINLSLNWALYLSPPDDDRGKIIEKSGIVRYASDDIKPIFLCIHHLMLDYTHLICDETRLQLLKILIDYLDLRLLESSDSYEVLSAHLHLCSFFKSLTEQIALLIISLALKFVYHEDFSKDLRFFKTAKLCITDYFDLTKMDRPVSDAYRSLIYYYETNQAKFQKHPSSLNLFLEILDALPCTKVYAEDFKKEIKRILIIPLAK